MREGRKERRRHAIALEGGNEVVTGAVDDRDGPQVARRRTRGAPVSKIGGWDQFFAGDNNVWCLGRLKVATGEVEANRGVAARSLMVELGTQAWV